MRAKLFYVFMVILVVFASGCRMGPVFNVDSAPVPQKLTVEQVEKAILVAGSQRGWIMKKDSPGHMTGTLNIRSHTAVIDVHYDPEKYSLTYKDSSNLKYDGTEIHSNYNGWIQNLQRNINAELLRMSN